MGGNVFAAESFFRQTSKAFFDAVKEGRVLEVNKLLRKEKYLIYEFDDTRQTPLHWAAIRGQHEVASILIEKKANINAKDIIGRTPLYNAAKMNNVKVVKILLAGRANPLIRTQGGKTPYMVTKNSHVKSYLTKATLLKICLPMIPNPQMREWVWEAEGLYYFNSSDQDDIDDILN